MTKVYIPIPHRKCQENSYLGMDHVYINFYVQNRTTEAEWYLSKQPIKNAAPTLIIQYGRQQVKH